MAAPLKGKLGKFVQTDIRSDEFSEFMIALDDFVPSDAESLSVGEMNKKLQTTFVTDVQKFLMTYTPVYNDAKEVHKPWLFCLASIFWKS